MTRNAIAESIGFDPIPGVEALDLSDGSQALAAWPGMAYVIQGQDLATVNGVLGGRDSLYGKDLRTGGITLRADLPQLANRQVMVFPGAAGQGVELRRDFLAAGEMPSCAMALTLQLIGLAEQNSNAFIAGGYYSITSGDGYPFGLYLRNVGTAPGTWYIDFKLGTTFTNRVTAAPVTGSGPHVIGFSYDAETRSSRAFFGAAENDATSTTGNVLPANTRVCVGGGVGDNASGVVAAWVSTVAFAYGAPHRDAALWADWRYMLDMLAARDIVA